MLAKYQSGPAEWRRNGNLERENSSGIIASLFMPAKLMA